jgi:hypothetical protein
MYNKPYKKKIYFPNKALCTLMHPNIMNKFTGHNMVARHNLFIYQSAVTAVEKTNCILPSRDAHGASVYWDHNEDPNG